MSAGDTFAYPAKGVAQLLCTLWDETARLDPTYVPDDPQMPKGPGIDPSQKGDHMVHVADISRAWERANLTLRQKQVLLLRYGMNWNQREAAEHLGLADESGARHLERRGIAALTNFLNGKREEYED